MLAALTLPPWHFPQVHPSPSPPPRLLSVRPRSHFLDLPDAPLSPLPCTMANKPSSLIWQPLHPTVPAHLIHLLSQSSVILLPPPHKPPADSPPVAALSAPHLPAKQVSASFALSKLCKRTGTVEAVVATPRAVSCLIAILLGNRPSFAAEFNCMLAKESSTHFQFPTLGRAFSHLSARACGDAALALAALANMRPPPEELIAAEGVLAEAALSPSGNNAVLGILGTLTRC